MCNANVVAKCESSLILFRKTAYRIIEITVHEKTIIPVNKPLIEAWQLTMKTFFDEALSDILYANVFPIFSQIR